MSSNETKSRTVPSDPNRLFSNASRGSLPTRLALVGALFAASVALSFIYYCMFGEFTRDSDQVNTFLMAQDMAKGNLFLSHWWISDDNFWLTDVALEAVLIVVFGAHPTIMFVAPAMIWAAIVILAVWACLRQREWSLAGLLSALALLALPVLRQNDPMQLIGRVPLHTASTVYILVMMFLAARMLRAQAALLEMAALAVITVAGVFSDPIIMVIGSASIALVAAVELLQRPQRRHAILLAVLVGGTLVGRIGPILMQRLGGLNAYHLPLRFVELKDLGANLWFGLYSLLLLTGTSFFGRTVPHAVPFLVRLPFLGLFAWGAWAVGHAYVRQAVFFETFRRIRPLDRILFMGVVINIVAGLLSDLLHGPSEVRYFFPALVCGTILCARALPSIRWLNTIALCAFTCTAAFTVASYIHRPPVVVVFDQGVSGVADRLRAENLTHGYASYWFASVITAASENQVHVAAVELNEAGRLQPKLWNSKATWYADFGRVRPFFVLADKQELPGKDIRATFGEPTRRIEVQDFRVLVYD